MDRPDRIHLHDYIIATDIGAFQSERGQQQRLRFNITVELAAPVTGAGDQVDDILSYDVLLHAIEAGLADQRYNLLETLAEQIAAQILTHRAAASVELSIEKLDRVPGALGITILRRAAQMQVTDTDGVRPIVLFMGTGDMQRDLSGQPVVIVPDIPALPLPVGGDQRRITILALDQAAWALAGQLGLDIADTRTELDWSIRQSLPVVWAPYRMVADNFDLPAVPQALAFWLAERLGAKRLELALHRNEAMPVAPAGFDLPVTRLS